MASTAKGFSDREDGEIVEDEFEDISDNSIILTTMGKCISPKGPLPEISLSSISDAEELGRYKNEKFNMCRRRKSHRKRKYSHRRTICLDTDSDDYVELDRKLLRAAIHIDNQDCLRNSLRKRLKVMTQSNECLNKAHEDILPHSGKNSSEDDENNLIQLRVEALRTAVFNRFKSRKRNKCNDISEIDEFEDIYSDNSEKVNNKENNIILHKEESVDNISIKNSTTPDNQGNVDSDSLNTVQDEDEDVLRALLLASLSKKISGTNSVNNPNMQPQKQVKDVCLPTNIDPQNSIKNVKNPYKKHTLTTNHIIPLAHTKVQPIIINVNGDSDTEDECSTNPNDDKCKISNKTIENSVEIFLKEQRAKVEAENTKSDAVFNKSSLKLLPKIKQIEYYSLLKKLHAAQKHRKQTHIIKQNNFNDKKLQSISISVPPETHKMHYKRFNTKELIKYKSSIITKSSTQCTNEVPDLRNVVRMLHKVLKEIQTKKSER